MSEPNFEDASVDPVRRRRAAIAIWTRRANRLGYLFFATAMILFVIAGVGGTFSGAMATLITVALILGTVLLAPAIVLGYAVRAAEKEDPGTTTPT